MTNTNIMENSKKINRLMGQTDYAKDLTLWILDCVETNEIESLESFIFNLNNKIAIDLSEIKIQFENIEKESK